MCEGWEETEAEGMCSVCGGMEFTLRIEKKNSRRRARGMVKCQSFVFEIDVWTTVTMKEKDSGRISMRIKATEL